MKNVCVITGGGSGMGLEVAKIIGKEQKIILVGRTANKIENAVSELKSLDIDAEGYACDISDSNSVKNLVSFAKDKGNIKTVIHSAGISPHMADSESIFKINAAGTIHINEEFAKAMNEGGCILNVSSMSAYILPEENIPKQIFKLGLSDTNAFLHSANQLFTDLPETNRTGMAYSLSKSFVIWYTSRMAIQYGRKGIRINSISPGTFKTPMGEVEGEEAAAFALNGALGRLGNPEEIAKMMAFMVSDECSYLCGVDILYDGGAIAAYKSMLEDA